MSCPHRSKLALHWVIKCPWYQLGRHRSKSAVMYHILAYGTRTKGPAADQGAARRSRGGPAAPGPLDLRRRSNTFVREPGAPAVSTTRPSCQLGSLPVRRVRTPGPAEIVVELSLSSCRPEATISPGPGLARGSGGRGRGGAQARTGGYWVGPWAQLEPGRKPLRFRCGAPVRWVGQVRWVGPACARAVKAGRRWPSGWTSCGAAGRRTTTTRP